MGSQDQQNPPRKLHSNLLIMQAFILALLPLVAFADHAPAYGYGPQYHSGIPTPLSTLRFVCPLSPPKSPPSHWPSRLSKITITATIKSELSVPLPRPPTNTSFAPTAMDPKLRLSPLKLPK